MTRKLLDNIAQMAINAHYHVNSLGTAHISIHPPCMFYFEEGYLCGRHVKVYELSSWKKKKKVCKQCQKQYDQMKGLLEKYNW